MYLPLFFRQFGYVSILFKGRLRLIYLSEESVSVYKKRNLSLLIFIFLYPFNFDFGVSWSYTTLRKLIFLQSYKYCFLLYCFLKFDSLSVVWNIFLNIHFFSFSFSFFFLFELEKSVWREADLYLKHSKIVLTRWYKLVIICKHEFLVNGIGEVYLMEFLLSFNTSLMSCVCIALIWLRMKNAVCTLICCG